METKANGAPELKADEKPERRFERESGEELTAESAYELEGEFAGELEEEDEFEDGSAGEEERLEDEFEYELEGDYEGAEFLTRPFRRTVSVLTRVARNAAPIVGAAVGSALGGTMRRTASSTFGEETCGAELEGEYEAGLRGELEDELEKGGELKEAAVLPRARQVAVAELMAAVAAKTPNEAEAEAMIGAATVTTLSGADRAVLQHLLPHFVRGMAVLTRILRRRRSTRPAVRVVPAIIRRAAKTLTKRAAAGKPVTRRTAAQVIAAQTTRVLGNPKKTAIVLQKNARTAHAAKHHSTVARTLHWHQ